MCPDNVCTICVDGYYLDENDLCQPCDYSCDLTCSSEGAIGCDNCKSRGYYMHEELGCTECSDW